MKNLNDNKCLLYCYIRKYLNPITANPSRISKKDIEISKEFRTNLILILKAFQ